MEAPLETPLEAWWGPRGASRGLVLGAVSSDVGEGTATGGIKATGAEALGVARGRGAGGDRGRGAVTTAGAGARGSALGMAAWRPLTGNGCRRWFACATAMGDAAKAIALRRSSALLSCSGAKSRRSCACSMSSAVKTLVTAPRLVLTWVRMLWETEKKQAAEVGQLAAVVVIATL